MGAAENVVQKGDLSTFFEFFRSLLAAYIETFILKELKS